MTLKGSCHCGAVRFEIARPPESLLECNCSICSRVGGLWAYYPLTEFTLLQSDEARTYRWSSGLVELNFCSTCGCHTHNVQPDWTKGDGSRRVAVNARMLEDFDLKSVPMEFFDGRGEL